MSFWNHTTFGAAKAVGGGTTGRGGAPQAGGGGSNHGAPGRPTQTGPTGVNTPPPPSQPSPGQPPTASALPAPKMTSMTTKAAKPGAHVAVNGTNLQGVTVAVGPEQVNLTGNTSWAAAFNIPVDAPPGNTAIVLTARDGLSTLSLPFTVLDPSAPTPAPGKTATSPTISSVSPTSGAVGAQVTLYGTNLTGVQVTVGASPAANATAIPSTATQLTILIPANEDPGATAITVTNSAGQSASIPFTVAAPSTVLKPTIASVYPTAGAPGDVITVTGTNLTPGLDVSLNNETVSGRTTGTTQLSFYVPSDATPGTGSLVITASDGTFAISPFTVLAATGGSGAGGSSGGTGTGGNTGGNTPPPGGGIYSGPPTPSAGGPPLLLLAALGVGAFLIYKRETKTGTTNAAPPPPAAGSTGG